VVRAYGHIVLWAFGGLAIGSNTSHKRWQRIAVSAAGPGRNSSCSGGAGGVAVDPAKPHRVCSAALVSLGGEEYVFQPLLWTFLEQMLFINLFWPLLNLLPIWPLDGGQISRELFTWARRATVSGCRCSCRLASPGCWRCTRS